MSNTPTRKPLMNRDETVMRWRLALATHMRDWRLNAGLTQDELAEAVGLDNKQSISAMENGRLGVPPDRYEAFADAFDVERSEFAKIVLRYSDPWMYAALFGTSNDPDLRNELASMPARVNQRRGPRLEAIQ